MRDVLLHTHTRYRYAVVLVQVNQYMLCNYCREICLKTSKLQLSLLLLYVLYSVIHRLSTFSYSISAVWQDICETCYVVILAYILSSSNASAVMFLETCIKLIATLHTTQLINVSVTLAFSLSGLRQ
jgi:hypothetical protein